MIGSGNPEAGPESSLIIIPILATCSCGKKIYGMRKAKDTRGTWEDSGGTVWGAGGADEVVGGAVAEVLITARG